MREDRAEKSLDDRPLILFSVFGDGSIATAIESRLAGDASDRAAESLEARGELVNEGALRWQQVGDAPEEFTAARVG